MIRCASHTLCNMKIKLVTYTLISRQYATTIRFFILTGLRPSVTRSLPQLAIRVIFLSWRYTERGFELVNIQAYQHWTLCMPSYRQQSISTLLIFLALPLMRV